MGRIDELTCIIAPVFFRDVLVHVYVFLKSLEGSVGSLEWYIHEQRLKTKSNYFTKIKLSQNKLHFHFCPTKFKY